MFLGNVDIDRLLRTWLLYLLLFFTSSPAFSAGLSIFEAIEIARLEHPSTLSQIAKKNAAERRVEAAKWLKFPSVSLQYGKSQIGNQLTTLRLDQPLWDGGSINAQINFAESEVLVAESAVLESENDITTRVVDAFVEFGKIDSRLVSAKSNVEEHQRLAEVIDRRVSSNFTPESDRILAQSRLAQAQIEQSRLEAQLEHARARLESIVNYSVNSVTFPDSLRGIPLTLDQLVDLAISNSPQIHRLQAEVIVKQAEIRTKKGATFPKVLARYERNFGDDTLISEQAFIAIEYQSGSGLSKLSNVKEVEFQQRSLLLDIQTAQLSIKESVTMAWADVQTLEFQIEGLTNQVDKARAYYDSTLRQYSAGRKSWLDVLNSQRETTQASYAMTDAKWSLVDAKLRLGVLVNKVNTVLNPTEDEKY